MLRFYTFFVFLLLLRLSFLLPYFCSFHPFSLEYYLSLFESVCSLFICYPSFYPFCFRNHFSFFDLTFFCHLFCFSVSVSLLFSFFCCLIWPPYDELIRYCQTCLNSVCWAFNWTSSSSYSPQLEAPHKASRGPVSCTFLFFFFCFSEFILCPLQDSEKYVEQLLTLFNRFSRLVKEAFQDDPRFLTARDKVSLL